MKNALLLIDPQNDFCVPEGALFVDGAAEDCRRLTAFIAKNTSSIHSIHITLDCHPCYHIAHPVFWRDQNNKTPPPYTEITYADFAAGKYKLTDDMLYDRVESYLQELEAKGRYNLTLWPPHCLMGSVGSCVEQSVWDAVYQWELKNPGINADYTQKAANPYTEHYSAIQAEVPDPDDPSTRMNFSLIDRLKTADRIIAAGEALSHCIANTIRDLTAFILPSKISLLTDCTSPVRGYADLGKSFIEEFAARGMKIISSTDLIL